MSRRRLPNRRPAVTHDLVVGNARVAATLGFDELGRPREIFLSGARVGADMAAILADASVVVSIALQHGISATALGLSVSRVGGKAASIIGGVLDLLSEYEQAT
jgi:hypothetical protein